MKLEKNYKEDKALFISIKPEFIEKILNGTKTIELRKSAPNIKKNDLIILYSTSPVMSIMGTCRVNEVVTAGPFKLWKDYSCFMGIDEKRYFDYFDGRDLAVGILLKEVEKMEEVIPLSLIRNKFKNFHPPQAFRYFDKNSLNHLLSK